MAGFEVTDFPYFIIGACAEMRDRAESMAQSLVERGKEVAPAAKGKTAGEALKRKGVERTDELTEAVGKKVEKLLDQMGLITKADIEALDKRLASLESKLESKAKAGDKKAKADEKKAKAGETREKKK